MAIAVAARISRRELYTFFFIIIILKKLYRLLNGSNYFVKNYSRKYNF